MADFDFNYTVGFTGDFGDIQKKIKVLADGIKPIDLKAQFPNLDTTQAQKAIDEIGKSGVIKQLSFETKSWTDQFGVVHEEIVKIIGSYEDLQGHAVRFSQAIPNAITGLEKQSKTYEHMVKKADEWSTRAETMGEKDKTAIQGTAKALKEQIAQWEAMKGKYDQASPQARKIQENIAKLNKELDTNIAASKRSAVATQSWGDRMAAAIKQTVTYTFTIGMMRKAQQEVNKAIQFAIELNKEMTKIQVLQAEGAQTPEEISALAQSYNDLAKEMGTTTMAVAQGSVEWLRQGKTIQETQELLRASTMLSKLGALEAAEATEYLTSTLNSYGMAAEEAVSIVDKLVQVDNISATSTKELATALRYSAATAKEAGVELEQLISYIAVVSSTTRQNAESIGQGMKTMFTRMQDIKAGAIDEDGLGLNNVESALARVNIALRDTPTTFRDMSSVLEDVAAKWSTLNDIEQANIAKAIAGVRQQNLFMVLMQNMGKAIEYQNEQFTANGVALDRYGIYLDSIEAKQQTFKATLEGLFMDVNFQDMIKSFIDLGINVLNLIEKIGGLRNALILVVSGMIAFKRTNILEFFGSFKKKIIDEIATLSLYNKRVKLAMINLHGYTAAKASATAATKTLSLATKSLNATIASTGWGIAIVAVGALISHFITLAEKAKEVKEALNEQIKKADEIDRNVSTVKNLENEFLSLKRTLDSTTASTEEKEIATNKLYDVQEKLKELMPELISYYDVEGRVTGITADNLSRMVGILEQDAARERELSVAIAEQNLTLSENASWWEKIARNYAIAAGALPADIGNENPIKGLNTAVEESFDKMNEAREKYLANRTDENLEDWQKEQKNYEFLKDIAISSYMIAGEESQKAFIEGFDSEEFKAYFQELFDTLHAEEIPQPAGNAPYKTDYKSLAPDMFTKTLYDMVEGAEKFEEVREKIAGGTFIPEDEISNLKKYNIGITTSEGGLQLLSNATRDYVESVVDLLIEEGKLTPEIREQAIAFVRNEIAKKKDEDATKDYTDSIKEASSQISVITNALKEQSSTGNISNQTYIDLIASNSNLKSAIEGTSGAYTLNAQKARDVAYATMYARFEAAGLGPAAVAAGDGLYDMALDAILAKVATQEVKDELINLLKVFEAFDREIKFPSFSGGGGGGGEDPAKKAIEGQIKALEDQKEAIQEAADERIELLEDEIEAIEEATENQVEALELVIEKYEEQIEKIEEAAEIEVKRLETVIDGHEKEIDALEEKKDAFNELIDKQKEALQEAKNADDYAEKQAKKAKDLGDLKTQIANMSLDTSDEGIAKRLELEEQAAELEGEILENSEDRKYDLQISALDKMAKAYEESIDAQIEAIEIEIQKIEDLITKTEEASEAQIKAIEKQIEVTEKQIDAIEKTSEAQVESIEKTIEAIKEETEDLIEAIDDQIKELRDQLGDLGSAGSASGGAISGAYTGVKLTLEEVLTTLENLGITFDNLNARQKASMIERIQEWVDLGYTIDEIIKKAEAYEKAADYLAQGIETTNWTQEGGQSPYDSSRIPGVHTGGLINAQGKVESHHAGNFAGNLKSNEVFAKLLKGEYVATEHQMDTFLKKILPQVAMHPDWDRLGSNSVGNITVNMPINVEGNMDSNVVPQIDAISKRVIDDINKALVARGFIRNTNLTVS